MRDPVQKAPQFTGRAALVLEVVMDRSAPPRWLQVVTSMPGRDGAVTKTWGLLDGAMDTSVAQDLHTWIGQAILDLALVSTGGVQNQLPV